MTTLVLGTAQFGASYGVTNRLGRISDAEIRAILSVAAPKVGLLDTSLEYGDAQLRLGQLAAQEFQYISKFALKPGFTASDVSTMLDSSLRDLGVAQLYGFMFHRTADLRDPRAQTVWDRLREARNEGTVRRIGASIYDHSDLDLIAEQFPDIDILQIPGNLLDRRLIDSAVLSTMRGNGTEIHVRSAYLQGVLLSDPEGLPPHFQRLVPTLESLREYATRLDVSVMELALGFLKTHPSSDAVVIGATTGAELSATVDSWGAAREMEYSFSPPQLPEDLIDPRMWPPRKDES